MIPTSSHFVCHWKAAWWTPKIRMQRFALEWEFLFEIRQIFNILFFDSPTAVCFMCALKFYSHYFSFICSAVMIVPLCPNQTYCDEWFQM